MKQFIAGVPLVTFINCQTKEEIKMYYVIDYNKFGDEIVLDYAIINNEEYRQILSWILNENFVKIKLEFNTYIGETENIVCCSKKGKYEEYYPVVMVYKPFVKNSNYETAGTIEFKIKVRE